MTDLPPGLLPPDLPRLEALCAWHTMWVGLLDERITDVRRREAEKRRAQERRPQPVLPMMPGMPERRTHDYLRHGITSLFAAFNIADGTVIGELHRRHRAVEFKKFLVTIDKAVPAGLDVHLVCDNYATHNTPEIKTWLGKHPRFHVHFTPTGSSWINQVERWFGLLTDKLVEREPQALHLDQDRRRDPQIPRRLPHQAHSASHR